MRNDFKIVLVCFVFAGCAGRTATNRNTASKQERIVAPAQSTKSRLQEKIFPLLFLLENDPAIGLAVKQNNLLQTIYRNRRSAISQAVQQCELVSCYSNELKWTETEIRNVGDEFIRLYLKSIQFHKLADLLKNKGVYGSVETDTALIRRGWESDAVAVNTIIDVYLSGKLPTYAKIDSISFSKTDAAFNKKIKSEVLEIFTQCTEQNLLFFKPFTDLAVEALMINGRDEAARYMPVEKGLNEKPYSTIPNINWNNYAYSVILVPGLGPEQPGVSLDPGGASRCRDGADSYHKGLAPFIVVSGGHVHPFKTPFDEAVEMKRYLVKELGVPETVVFIEPDARHTTTNLRNVNRLIYHFSIPANKPVLIVTDSAQNNYIVKGMEKVAMRDLGYLPYENIQKLTEKQSKYFPSKQSLRVNPKDPLDP